ncbi:hypothetical protein HPP92_027535 [Vanilla planifolia]|uniref:PA domain-containing protein n=1 Tax=Vanilla planifolia TaxID=51239 RepID=A0A835U551_VANPL|nr:hypothetical protein HPP92_027535 [Vanilla planifolia]
MSFIEGTNEALTLKGRLASLTLIGARYYVNGYESANGPQSVAFRSLQDTVGHGTQSLSAAGGSLVSAANFLGYGNGTAKGGCPRASVTAYKVCWPPVNGSECFDADILAGFKADIHDRCPLRLPLQRPFRLLWRRDRHRSVPRYLQRNRSGDVCRKFWSEAGVGDKRDAVVADRWGKHHGQTVTRLCALWRTQTQGESLSNASLPRNKMLPLIRSGDAAAAKASYEDARVKSWKMGSLDAKKVKGKIVVYIREINAGVEKGEVVKLADGKGMVLVNGLSGGDETIADLHLLPATHL